MFIKFEKIEERTLAYLYAKITVEAGKLIFCKDENICNN